MPVTPQDRPLDALREETVDQLIMNYGHGTLSREAFERRLDEALDSRSHDQLVALTRDLDLQTDKQYAEQKRTELGIRTSNAPPTELEDVEWMINIFGGSRRSGAWDVPREIKMVSIFGGCELDFTDARFASPVTQVTMLCLFGGASFFVREDMRTISKVLCIFGGVSNRAPATNDPNAPTLVIHGLALFGGADVRVRKTMRQRLHEFADTLRGMFDPEPPGASPPATGRK